MLTKSFLISPAMKKSVGLFSYLEAEEFVFYGSCAFASMGLVFVQGPICMIMAQVFSVY